MTKKGDEPTLMDALVRMTFAPYFQRVDKQNQLRPALLAAKKFVLDDAMSAFSADLAYASLISVGRNHGIRHRTLEAMRQLSRLPHSTTWIEMNGRARTARANYYGALLDPERTPRRLGWLLQQHPTIDTAFTALECVSDSLPPGGDEFVPECSPNWFRYAWRTDEGPLPWKPVASFKQFQGTDINDWENWDSASALLTGVQGYHSPQVEIVDGLIPYSEAMKQKAIAVSHVNEYASDLRYIWALLSTINQLPLRTTEVKASKGYVARGSYKKFVDHTTITLVIPARKSIIRLAKEAIALARRRRHTVRGHWRTDHRHPSERLWVKEHERGDASLGFVTHDYKVTHPTTMGV